MIRQLINRRRRLRASPLGVPACMEFALSNEAASIAAERLEGPVIGVTLSQNPAALRRTIRVSDIRPLRMNVKQISLRGNPTRLARAGIATQLHPAAQDPCYCSRFLGRGDSRMHFHGAYAEGSACWGPAA